jgi:DNA-binding NarL/FixJ family response regulator
VTVLIVDDNSVVRSGLRNLLEASPQVRVIGDAWDGDRAVELARALLPDVVLLDVRMPRRDGVSVAREISSLSRVLMMTFTDDHDVIRESVEAGAVGYLVNGTFDVADLTAAVLAASRGSGTFTVGALEALRAPAPAPPVPDARRAEVLGLSVRQGEIMAAIAAGRSNVEIARAFFLSEKTVKNHINRIFATLGVRTRGEAIALWFRVEEPATASPGTRGGRGWH